MDSTSENQRGKWNLKNDGPLILLEGESEKGETSIYYALSGRR
jgi:hypothetical protein